MAATSEGGGGGSGARAAQRFAASKAAASRSDDDWGGGSGGAPFGRGGAAPLRRAAWVAETEPPQVTWMEYEGGMELDAEAGPRGIASSPSASVRILLHLSTCSTISL